jgi:hypothetical protein
VHEHDIAVPSEGRCIKRTHGAWVQDRYYTSLDLDVLTAEIAAGSVQMATQAASEAQVRAHARMHTCGAIGTGWVRARWQAASKHNSDVKRHLVLALKLESEYRAWCADR